MTDRSLIDEIINSNSGLATDYETKQAEALSALKASSPRTDYQNYGEIGLGLLPLLLGAALGGKKGLHAGAQGALTGVSTFESALKKKEEDTDAVSKAMAAIYGEKAKEARKSAEDLRGKAALKEVFPNQGTSVSIDNKVESEGSKIMTKELLEAERVRKTGNRILDGIDNSIAELEKLGVKPDETWTEALTRNVKGAIDPNSPEGRLQRKITEQLVRASADQIKGNPTEPEQERLAKAQGAQWRISLGELKQINQDRRNALSRAVEDLEEVSSRRGLTVPGSKGASQYNESGIPKKGISVNGDLGLPPSQMEQVISSLEGKDGELGRDATGIFFRDLMGNVFRIKQ